MRLLLTLLLLVPLCANAALRGTAELVMSNLSAVLVTGDDNTGEGAVVVVYGWNICTGLNTADVTMTDGGATERTATVIYCKNADGQLPGFPARLYDYFGFEEVAFSTPSASAAGTGTIHVTGVNGVDSNDLSIEFNNGGGNIFFVDEGGSDVSGTGTFSSPWRTMESVLDFDASARLECGDIVYMLDQNVSAGALIKGPYNCSGSDPLQITSYPGTYTNNWANQGGNFRAIQFHNSFGPYNVVHFSGIFFPSTNWVIEPTHNSRLIGNSFDGPAFNGTGTQGVISATRDGGPYWGNSIMAIATLGPRDVNVGPKKGDHTFYVSNDRSANETTLTTQNIRYNVIHHSRLNAGARIYSAVGGGGCGGFDQGPGVMSDNIFVDQSSNAIEMRQGCSPVVDVNVERNIVVITPNPGVPSSYWNNYPSIASGRPFFIMFGSSAADPTYEINTNLVYGNRNASFMINVDNSNGATNDVVNAEGNIFVDRDSYPIWPADGHCDSCVANAYYSTNDTPPTLNIDTSTTLVEGLFRKTPAHEEARYLLRQLKAL